MCVRSPPGIAPRAATRAHTLSPAHEGVRRAAQGASRRPVTPRKSRFAHHLHSPGNATLRTHQVRDSSPVRAFLRLDQALHQGVLNPLAGPVTATVETARPRAPT